MHPSRPAVELFLAPAARELVRGAIARAGGNEVCFVAALGEDGEVVEPRVIARGNAAAVLALLRDPEPGGLLIHNHPSGILEPSEDDLAVAAALWEQGLGFAITDNDAGELYVVLEPPEPDVHQPLDLDALTDELAPGGALAAGHPRYEDRPQQRELSRLIGELYNEGGVAVAEAGTGTGKSLAYLLPAVRWALRNGERTVVSTNTINLQEQLVGRDLPLLRRALGEPFRFALVKGRSNYVSIRRALLASENAGLLLDEQRQSELAALVEWSGTTLDGSLSDLPFRPSPEVWDEVQSDTEVCLRARCPHFEGCHYQRARRAAAAANVLVVNHHLLFSDLSIRRAQGNWTAPAVLPPYRRLVLDEAHNLEEAATAHLGSSVSRRGLFRTLGRLENRGRGLLPALRGALSRFDGHLVARSALDLIEDALVPPLAGSRERAGSVFSFLADVFPAGEGVVRLEDGFDAHPVWPLGLDDALGALLEHLKALGRGITALRERIGADEVLLRELEAPLVELRGASGRVEAAGDALRGALRPGDGGMRMVRWMERQTAREGREGNLVLNAAPLDLREVLRGSLFERASTVLLTSATLATGGSFAFVRDRLGLAGTPEGTAEVREALFPSPFDYARQTLLGVPTDLPLPAGDHDPRHDEATVRATLELARLTEGGLFVLFTSHRALRHVAGALRARGADGRWPLFVHGEAPRDRLVEGFTAAGGGILLGTSSFWEGVDVPGEPLRGLVIPRLPFRVPTEPVTAARVEAIERSGGNSFLSYMLPHAAIRMKQGFGRLIRSTTDRGAVLVLDGRIAKKSYGRYLLASLPPAPLVTGPWREVRSAVEGFYAAGRAERRAG
jgi:ATP-dependent DNA helicase DinG